MSQLSERLEQLEPKILDSNFRTGRGTANEVNFWIVDYDAEDEMQVRDYIEFLEKHINSRHDEVKIKIFDLYDIVINVLEEKGYLDKVVKMERAKGSGEIIDPIKSTLRLTLDSDLVVAKITEDLTPETDIIILMGIGKAWPIIRSHTILNNLHDKVDRNPLVMFFPGHYTNKLSLFGEITDDNYYRAFKLV